MGPSTKFTLLLLGSVLIILCLEADDTTKDPKKEVDTNMIKKHSYYSSIIIPSILTAFHYQSQEDNLVKQLASQTLSFILQSAVTVGSNNTSTSNVSFVAPCSIAYADVLESTEALLVATAVAKGGENDTAGWNLFEFFDAVFATGGRYTRILPKYSYPIVTTEGFPPEHVVADKAPRYIEDTRIPNWSLFYWNETQPWSQECDSDDNLCWLGSNRISAIPFHASFLLDLISQLESERGVQDIHHWQIQKIQSYWDRIYKYHQYLHEVVMRGCQFPESDVTTNAGGASGNNTDDEIPCYNIVHPWESLVDLTSPIWNDALKPTQRKMKKENWTRSWDLPTAVRESYDYDEHTYEAMLYLADCLGKVTQNTTADKVDSLIIENYIIQSCPFAMLDVGYATALAQSDRALLHSGLWLSAQNTEEFLSHAKLAQIQKWSEQSQDVLNHLWSNEEQSYLSQYATEIESNRTFPTMMPTSTAVADNLMVFWMQWERDSQFPDEYNKKSSHPHLSEMASQLLHRSGKYSFDCGQNPLPSHGCDQDGHNPAIVSPVLNYFIGLGMKGNKRSMLAFGNYISNATLSMICGEEDHISTQCALNGTWFPEAFAVDDTALPLSACGSTSTATAAVLFHLLVGNAKFTYEKPIPPIRNSWVITLITVELSIAFLVGVGCVTLSLTLLRKENSNQQRGTTDEAGSYMAFHLDEEGQSLSENGERQPQQGTFSEVSSIDTNTFESSSSMN